MSSQTDYEYFKIASVQKAFALLALLRSNEGSMRLSQLAAESGLPKSSVYRLLKTMEIEGIVEFSQSCGRYSLGSKLAHLGAVREQ